MCDASLAHTHTFTRPGQCHLTEIQCNMYSIQSLKCWIWSATTQMASQNMASREPNCNEPSKVCRLSVEIEWSITNTNRNTTACACIVQYKCPICSVCLVSYEKKIKMKQANLRHNSKYLIIHKTQNYKAARIPFECDFSSSAHMYKLIDWAYFNLWKERKRQKNTNLK